MPASTIHLGEIGEVGYVAESSDRHTAISFTYGEKMLTEREFQAAQQAISGRLKAKLCSLLMVQEEDLDPTKGIVTYGLDSLIAVEFRNWVAKEVGARIQLLGCDDE